jgi:4-diphosphocytidyl-2-C-methyl-D-erythritol kinase
VSALRTRAPGKVNLSLALGPSRPDGRHELATLVQALSLADDVRLEPGAGADEVACPAVEGENLAARALAAYRRATGWDAPPVRVTIVKHVPVAAGMGGGSSDAAATLRLAAAAAAAADSATASAASAASADPGAAGSAGPAAADPGAAGSAGPAAAADPDLLALAATLGADVPALLEPGLVLAAGAGERVERLDRPAPFAFLVLPSPHRLSTADVYREADRLGLPRSLDDVEERRRALRGELTDDVLVNDLEHAARALCPSIDSALADAHAAGARVALVSGSGPTVVGLFGAHDDARAAAEALRDRHPGARAARAVGPEAGAVVPA